MKIFEDYERLKAKLLNDENICSDNRALFREFFEFEERKLKRMNQLAVLDEPCCKTLYGYVGKLRNVNMWFKNKPWTALTREDIERVYEDLEEGRIVTRRGVRFQDRAGYYNRIMKSKPFRMAGKSELAKDVIEFAHPRRQEVRFLSEEQVRRLTSCMRKPEHFLLIWLAWDIGENIGALLMLSKSDFRKQISSATGEAEYVVTLPSEKIKRSRTARSEPTLYRETVQYADIVLARLENGDRVFPFGRGGATRMFQRAAKVTGIRAQPDASRPRFKDLRSGMACHLLRSGWSREEVNARLGHTPSSDALDAYINHLAIDRDGAKKKLHSSHVARLQSELEISRQRERLQADRLEREVGKSAEVRTELEKVWSALDDLRAQIKRAASAEGSPH